MKTFLTLVFLLAAFNPVISQVNQEWVKRYNGMASYTTAASMVTDNAGNVYVTGNSYCKGIDTTYSVYTIKYSPNGGRTWSTRYIPARGIIIKSTAIAVDGSGNVYVAGYISAPNGNDYILIKYNSSSIKQWEVKYNNFSVDQAERITIDGSGNIYVTGQSIGMTSGNDFATLKYNPSGVLQWAARYNSGGTANDVPVAIAVNSSGDVYVSGRANDYYFADYSTVKYNSSGVQQWTRTFAGAGPTDIVSDMKLDNSGNIYVTGHSYNNATSDYDFLTIKYNSSGNQLWNVFYNGPGSDNDISPMLYIDASANVFLAGVTIASGFYDYAAVKYNSSGIQQWAQTYNGGSDDQPFGICGDAYGNIFVSGTSWDPVTKYDYAVVKYNSTGTQQWVSRYNGYDSLADQNKAMTVDPSGKICLFGTGTRKSGFTEFAAVGYNSSGALQWVDRFSGYGENYAGTVKTDKFGNICIGSSAKGDSTNVILTTKYDKYGYQQWVRKYSAAGLFYITTPKLELDTSGNVFVAATGYNAQIHEDILIVKYNASGEKQWDIRYSDPFGISDAVYGLKVDEAGNAYILYTVRLASLEYRIGTMKINPAGVMLWKKTFQSQSLPGDLELDAAGNVYVVGNYSVGLGWYSFKYNSAGTLLWQNSYSGSRVQSLTIDRAGYLYAAGTITVNGLTKAHITKYNSAGNVMWLNDYNDTTISYSYYINTITDTNCALIFSGTLVAHSGKEKISAVKLDSAGTVMWSKKFISPQVTDCNSKDMKIDKDGDIYIGGDAYYSVDPSATDFLIVKYNNAGVFLWNVLYSYNPNGIQKQDFLSSLAIDTDKNVIVAGSSLGDFGSYEIATIKYSQASGRPVIDPFGENSSPAKFKLFDNYPNPFNPKTVLKYSIGYGARVSLAVYDITGREITKLVNNEYKDAGSYTVELDGSNMASGVYFYKITAGNFTGVKKMVLIK